MRRLGGLARRWSSVCASAPVGAPAVPNGALVAGAGGELWPVSAVPALVVQSERNNKGMGFLGTWGLSLASGPRAGSQRLS